MPQLLNREYRQRQANMLVTSPAPPTVLLVDDESPLLRSTALALRTAGIESVYSLNDSREVESVLATESVSVALVDLNMPFLPGAELLKIIRERHPETAVIILTAANEVTTAVDCMRHGAFDYLVKPVEKTRLVSSVKRALEAQQLHHELTALRHSFLNRELRNPEAFSPIITDHEAIKDLCRYIDAISRSGQPVLITGETGTGKELFARAVHDASARTGQFVAVTVSGLDDTTFSDTLFGHKRGAFTGADGKRDGLIASAENGTLFLDEIGDLAITSQVKLLRLLQEKEYYPLGDDSPQTSSARIVVATNVDLDLAIRSKRFRQDLYYRLKPHHVHIPPLRERLEDIPMLVDHFVECAASELDKSAPGIPVALYQLLNTYAFPGNVRELQGMVFDAVARQQSSMLGLGVFRKAIGLEDKPKPPLDNNRTPIDFPATLPSLKELEDAVINEALKRADGNQGIAAGLLGITRQALNKRLIRARGRETLPPDDNSE